MKKAYFSLTVFIIILYNVVFLGLSVYMNGKNTVEEVKLVNSAASQQVKEDLEIKDATMIFNAAWNELVAEKGGEEKMQFPREIFWLNGAPGAGKGTNTRFIMEYRDITAAPIVISDLLQSEEAKKRKDAGLLVGDKEVIGLMLRELMKPKYKDGVILDGFPRTKTQVECVKLLHNKLMQLHAKSLSVKGAEKRWKTTFHIVVLFIDEAESIKRQIDRGRKAIEHNKAVAASGVGEVVEVRKTDLNEEDARTRYRVFKESTYDSLQTLKEVFHYHFINAQGTIAQVQERILEELQYQSSLELTQGTFDQVNRIALASEIVKNARQHLVERLEGYEANDKVKFEKVIRVITDKIMPVVQRHSITGVAQVNLDDVILGEEKAIDMLIDVFSERGYHALVDIDEQQVADKVEMTSGRVHTKTRKVYHITVNFRGSEIRRGAN